MEFLKVPFPALSKGNVLVRNHYSVISAGTEGKTAKDARLSYVGKARSRQKEVKQVIELAKSQGLISTYKAVMNKLNTPSALGYSCAGEVIAIGEGVSDYKIGDLVACGGGSAVHAEVVSVPKNLCVRIPDDVDLKEAAFATIAAISIQGIRQADLRLGENCVIIGLGLIGILTVQLLNAAGIQTIGIDTDPRRIKMAKQTGIILALERNSKNLEQIILNQTAGHGTDVVIITAGTTSLDPIELGGTLCRKKGKVVIVGSVPTGFSRANYYKKELDLRMSTSYGPGRYDANYEEKGIDYPYGYVRWTENRNMLAFLQLLKDEKLNINKLISHEFAFGKAPEAYQMILEKSEPFIGIVLKYDAKKKTEKLIKLKEGKFSPKEVNVGFIGAGSFAQNFLLPTVHKIGNMIGLADAQSSTTRIVADKYHFQYATGNADDIIADDKINTIFIATPHNLHSEYVLKAIKQGKNVFVEKPLAMTIEELEEIKASYLSIPPSDLPHLMVGFNRRFAPHIQKIKKLFPENDAKAINYRINAGTIPADHWIHDQEIGGGRIIGEVCHFVDLCMYITGSKIMSIAANVMSTPQNLMDTLVVNISFANGSIASISYFSNGNRAVNKEYLEVFYANQVAIIDDFKKMSVFSEHQTKMNLSKKDKGHDEEVKKFISSIKEGKESPISFDEIYLSTLATFKIIESIKNRKIVILA